ncbi:MAG: hypothetical protein QT00_C0001G0377 [archaeon GW2011_AR5]|nr:MAG: hypothetical protein QT00_C0001G0377 [archaeon GW2011_AR5]
MRAYIGATGLSVVAGSNDRENVRHECTIGQYKKPRLFLRVVKNVEKRGFMEESGFHMQCWPPNAGLRRSTKIYVQLSRDVWDKITTEYDREAGGGFFCSRCKYDRFHINYYDMNIPATA